MAPVRDTQKFAAAEAIALGFSHTQAASQSGLSRRTITRYMGTEWFNDLVAEAKELADTVREENFRKDATEIADIRQDAINAVKEIVKLRSKPKERLQAALWVLGRTDPVETKPPDDPPDALTDEKLDERVRHLLKVAGYGDAN